MTTLTDLRATLCAVCRTGDGAKEMYPATIDAADFASDTFSARRLPDRVHYRIVRCRRCGLVRSDPVADPDQLAGLYRSAAFNYESEVPNLIRTYGRYLAKVACSRERGSLLEIGCGNGFMLAEARRAGFASVTGIEPSTAAIERADPDVRPYLFCDILRAGVLEPGHFSLVCMFQVFDHLPDPVAALDLCWEAMTPGGCLLLFHHNVRSLSARILGERSPIVDVEHTYLYDLRTLSSLCASRGFIIESAAPAWNWCSLGYLARLLPLPLRLKAALLRVLSASRLDRFSMVLPLGNLFLIARKPLRSR